MRLNRLFVLILPGVLAGVLPAAGQEPTEDRWTIHFQATSIGQHHGAFPSLYEGENGLPPHSENRVSLTATVFLGFRVNRHVELVVNPEVALRLASYETVDDHGGFSACWESGVQRGSRAGFGRHHPPALGKIEIGLKPSRQKNECGG